MIANKFNITRQMLFWAKLGWYDILSRYRSTVLGVFWIVLINGMTILAIGMVYGSLFRVDLHKYFPYLTVGYITWLWISTSFVEIASSLTSYRFILLSHAVDPTSVVMRVFSRNFIVFLHNLPIIALVLLIYAGRWHATWLLFPVNLLIISALLVGVGGAVAFLCARFHDVQMIISAAIGVLFLITPIIWSPDILKERAYIAMINPLRHVLDLLRKPLLGEIPSLTNYSVTFVIALAGLLVFGIVYRYCKRQYIHWL